MLKQIIKINTNIEGTGQRLQNKLYSVLSLQFCIHFYYWLFQHERFNMNQLYPAVTAVLCLDIFYSGLFCKYFILGTGSVPSVQIQQSSYTVNSGNSVTLQCTITSTTSTVTNVYWQRTNGNIVTTINSNTNANKYSGSTTSSPLYLLALVLELMVVTILPLVLCQ
jgi:hypothetical protein